MNRDRTLSDVATLGRGKAVLITGASTGIGRRLSECLAAAGCIVYAGARNECDLQALAAIRNVRPLRLDVTRPSDIASAIKTLDHSYQPLHGLVNNAGILTLGPVIDGNDAEFDLTMAVNVHGTYRVTKAFAPLIAATKGRITMISSVAGTLTEKNVSAYAMSKHAIEALADCLAEELAPLDVFVSVVVPGTYKTQIGANANRRAGSNPLMPDFSNFKDPDDVVTAIVFSLFESRPQKRYLVVPHAGQAESTITKQIAKLVQMNQGHMYSYDRDALVRLLDEALEREHP